jgi:hypothetical protein
LRFLILCRLFGSLRYHQDNAPQQRTFLFNHSRSSSHQLGVECYFRSSGLAPFSKQVLQEYGGLGEHSRVATSFRSRGLLQRGSVDRQLSQALAGYVFIRKRWRQQ